MEQKKILIAAGAFKDVLTPIETCELIASQLPNNVNKILTPMIDGGEYCYETLPYYETKYISSCSPLFECRKYQYQKWPNNSVFLSSSHFLRMPNYPNPLELSSFGFGLAIARIIEKESPNHIYLGLGGTSTIDGGLPMMASLRNLHTSHRQTKVTLLCDGSTSISQMRVPSERKIHVDSYEDAKRIANTALHAVEVYADQLGITSNQPFFGVAGGLAITFQEIFTNHVYELGASFFAKLFDLEHKIKVSDVVITGEGRFDNSLDGKTPIFVSQLAKKYNKPVIYFVGTESPKWKAYAANTINTPPTILKEVGVTTYVTCSHTSGTRLEAMKKTLALLGDVL